MTCWRVQVFLPAEETEHLILFKIFVYLFKLAAYRGVISDCSSRTDLSSVPGVAHLFADSEVRSDRGSTLFVLLVLDGAQHQHSELTPSLLHSPHHVFDVLRLHIHPIHLHHHIPLSELCPLRWAALRHLEVEMGKAQGHGIGNALQFECNTRAFEPPLCLSFKFAQWMLYASLAKVATLFLKEAYICFDA